jgi:hypothetical protein
LLIEEAMGAKNSYLGCRKEHGAHGAIHASPKTKRKLLARLGFHSFLLSSPTSPSSPHVIGFRSIHAGLQVLQDFYFILFVFLED